MRKGQSAQTRDETRATLSLLGNVLTEVTMHGTEDNTRVEYTWIGRS